ncbi:acryloyl-CoA reductase [Paenibacillus yanchengensis]|uniref:Acryloyl-CoA reductase n=1 Tax=Paenibacillus yanchengensis TaxID=2035833 RepID=A0ABW4YIK6_9BACL
MKEPFQALVLDPTQSLPVSVQPITLDQLPAGDVLIKVVYSSVNYKDALACQPNGKIVRAYPFIPGIDLAGYVVTSTDDRFHEGQAVLATGYDIGVSHFGGFSQYVRLPSKWIVPLPEQLSLREAMIYGTAGFTAALSIQRLEENGVQPPTGKVLVTGATGGVGGTAIAMLHKLGYDVVASTGKQAATSYLHSLGAQEIISREAVVEHAEKSLNKQLWQAAIDPVGGTTLASILSKLTYGGSVAVSGLTGGSAVATTVMPFILRGVNLLGIDSVFVSYDVRAKLWERMATDMKPAILDLLVDREISLIDLPQATEDILHSQTQGRIIVRL